MQKQDDKNVASERFTFTRDSGQWELVIGCEIHVQAKTKHKLFSSSLVEFGAEPNTDVSIFDASFPGMLPIINKEAVEQAVKTGLALNAEINKFSVFDRKHYFYPDLPQGYQITQLYYPIVGKGYLDILVNGLTKRINIDRIHLEQDAGKLLHDMDHSHSFVDLNRSGVPLMEIVSAPDMTCPDDVVEFVKTLRNLLRYIDSSDADMEKGQLRCDVNISVRKAGVKELGTRCEIKNMNSTKFMAAAILYEAERQIELLESGKAVEQETRAFNPKTGKTRTLRNKENALDYRYFPDPDLVPLVLEDEFIAQIKHDLPELPANKLARYENEYGLSRYDASVLASNFEFATYFDSLVKAVGIANAKMAANWLTSELFSHLNSNNMHLSQCLVTSDKLAELLQLILKDVISGKIAKQVLKDMFDSGEAAESIIRKKGLIQISDKASILKVVEEVIAENSKQYEAYKNGDLKLLGFFVGQVMKKTEGNANPAIVNEVLKERL